MKGLIADVLRPARSIPEYRQHPKQVIRTDGVTIVGTIDRTEKLDNTEIVLLDRYSQVFEPTAERPAVVLVLRRPTGDRIVNIEPAPEDGTFHWYCAGSAYVTTSDSRFRETIEQLLGQSFYGALSLHDWLEW